MGVCNCSMFCCALLCVHSSMAIIMMGKRELVALLNLSSWCLMMVEGLFLTVLWGCLRFVIVVFPDHTHLLFLIVKYKKVSENDKEIPQIHSADQPMAPCRRATEYLYKQCICINSKVTSFLFLFKKIAKLEWTQSNA